MIGCAGSSAVTWGCGSGFALPDAVSGRATVADLQFQNYKHSAVCCATPPPCCYFLSGVLVGLVKVVSEWEGLERTPMDYLGILSLDDMEPGLVPVHRVQNDVIGSEVITENHEFCKQVNPGADTPTGQLRRRLPHHLHQTQDRCIVIKPDRCFPTDLVQKLKLNLHSKHHMEDHHIHM